MMAGEPLWIVEARRHIGVREIPGKETAPVIAGWLRKLRAAMTAAAVEQPTHQQFIDRHCKAPAA